MSKEENAGANRSRLLYHYTDRAGYNSLRAAVDWCFKASQPPGRPFGAYFTTLGPATKNLALRLRIPRAKIAYVFAFDGQEDLKPLGGSRGAYILYCTSDYVVPRSRQRAWGTRADVEAKLLAMGG
jgi:hypothetical protein